jgi:hypothetical protein
MDLEEVWRIREEEVYPKLFGGVQRGIFPLTSEVFSKRFGRSEIDPTWLFYGVFEHGPTPERPYWLYVTSAHSNPWGEEPKDYDPNGFSGSGTEFLFASKERGDWAILFLQNMLAYDILLGIGHFAGGEPFQPGNRIPLRSPINGQPGCQIRNAIASQSEALPTEFHLPSGQVDLLTFTGVTDSEIAFAKETSTDALIEKLKAAGQYPVTDTKREPVV